MFRSPFRTAALPVAALALALALAAPPAGALEEGEFDPAAWQAELEKYVTDNGVDFAAWAKDPDGIDAFLAAAAGYDLRSVLGKEPRAAFLLNAYNAWGVRQILEHWPVKSTDEIEGFYDANRTTIAGEERSLNEIEALLAEYLPAYPQFAMGLTPGTRGTPALGTQAYTGETFKALVVERAGVFFEREGTIHYDEDANELHVPDAIHRHLDLYDNMERGLAGFLAESASMSLVMKLLNNGPTIVAIAEDHHLNAATPGAE